jgi:hypothetical protein
MQAERFGAWAANAFEELLELPDPRDFRGRPREASEGE